VNYLIHVSSPSNSRPVNYGRIAFTDTDLNP